MGIKREGQGKVHAFVSVRLVVWAPCILARLRMCARRGGAGGRERVSASRITGSIHIKLKLDFVHIAIFLQFSNSFV